MDNDEDILKKLLIAITSSLCIIGVIRKLVLDYFEIVLMKENINKSKKEKENNNNNKAVVVDTKKNKTQPNIITQIIIGDKFIIV